MIHDVVRGDDFEPDYDLMRDLALESDDDDLVEDDPEPDDELVLRLLSGTTRLIPNSPLVRYLTPEEERKARRNLQPFCEAEGRHNS